MFIAFPCCMIVATQEVFTNTARGYMVVGRIAKADEFFGRACHKLIHNLYE